jgi:hypothetical protein
MQILPEEHPIIPEAVFYEEFHLHLRCSRETARAGFKKGDE